MTPHAEAARASFLPGTDLPALVRGLARAFAAALAQRRTARAVRELDDHLLRDIGLQGVRLAERELPLRRPDLWI